MPFNVGQAVGYLMLDTSNWENGFKKARAGMKSFMDESATASDKFTAIGSSMTSTGAALTLGVTAPILGIGAAAISAGNDFEAQMSRVQAIAGATGEELNALTDQAIDLGASTSFSATEAAQGMEELASAGFSVNEIMEAMPGMLDLAASAGIGLADAAAITSAAINGFGLEASDSAHVANVFARAAADTNAGVLDMGEAMKYVAPVASAFGQTIEMTAAAVGILSDAGIQGSQAGTTLRSMFSSLAKPTQQATEAMERYGLSFYDAQGNMLPLVDIIDMLNQNLSGLTQEERNAVLITLFGQEALSGVLALMDRGADDLQTLTDNLEDSDGAAQSMADTMLNNTAGAMEELSGAIETLLIKIQQAIAPTLTKIINWLANVVSWFTSLDDSIIQTIVIIGAVVAAVGPLLLIFGQLAMAIGAIIPIVSSITGALSGLIPFLQLKFAGALLSVTSGVGGLSGALAALSNPIGWVIAAVVALSAAWITNFGGMRDKTAEIFSAIQEIISSVMGIIKSIWDNNLFGIQTVFKDIWTTIEQLFSDVLTVIVDIFNVFAALFSGDWDALWKAVQQLVSDVWTMITNLIGNALNLIIDTILGIGVTLYSAVRSVFQMAENAVKSVWTAIINWFKGAVNDPVGTILGIGTAMYNAGREIFTQLWNGIKSLWTSIQNWVQEKIDWLVDKITFWDNESKRLGGSSVTISTGKSDGSYASGLDYVPRDMNVRVHEGEAILTAEENQNRRTMQSGGDTYNFYSPEALTPVKAAREFKRVKQELALGYR